MWVCSCRPVFVAVKVKTPQDHIFAPIDCCRMVDWLSSHWDCYHWQPVNFCDTLCSLLAIVFIIFYHLRFLPVWARLLYALAPCQLLSGAGAPSLSESCSDTIRPFVSCTVLCKLLWIAVFIPQSKLCSFLLSVSVSLTVIWFVARLFHQQSLSSHCHRNFLYLSAAISAIFISPPVNFSFLPVTVLSVSM